MKTTKHEEANRKSQTNKVKSPNEKKNSNSQEESPILYCSCKKPWEDEEFYIGCDFCENWFHGKCVGISSSIQGIELYRCEECRERKNTTPLTPPLNLIPRKANEEAAPLSSDKIQEISNHLKEAEEKCKMWKENSSKLQTELNKKQKCIDAKSSEVLQLKSGISDLSKNLKQKESELKTCREEKNSFKEKYTSTSNTAEILSKKCTKIEKESTKLNLGLKKEKENISKLNKQNEENTAKIESLKSEKKNLELELGTLKKVSSVVDKTKPSNKKDESQELNNKEKTKKKEKEIESLKDLVKNMELVVRDLQAEKLNLQQKCDAQEHELEREKYLNNLLMGFTGKPKVMNATECSPSSAVKH